MSDIFAEVDEAMKQERLEKLWKDYGGFIIGFLTIVVLGTAANAGYTSWKTASNIKSTDLYLGIAQKTNYTADEIIQIAPKLNSGIKSIALLSAAHREYQDGNTQKAVEIYKQITADTQHDPSMIYLAQYMVTSHDAEKSQEEKLQQFTAMSSDENNPYRYRAYLDAAMLEAHLNNDFTKARSYFNIIAKAEFVPQTIKQKAQSLDIVYTIKGTTEQK